MSEKSRDNIHSETIASFISYIEMHPGISISDISRYYEVTDRTVREYVRTACEELDSFAHISCEGNSYTLVVDDPAAYSVWRRGPRGVLWNGIPSTPQERIAFLVNDLLKRADWVTLDALARTLFCSRRTITSALDGVSSYVKPFGLHLERRPHRGVRIEGPEDKRRICLANSMLDYMAKNGDIFKSGVERSDSSGSMRQKGYGDYSLATIAACVDEATDEGGFIVNSVAYQNLLVHIAVAVMRVRAGCYVSDCAVEGLNLYDSDAWDVAQSIADRVSRSLNIELPQSEVAYIAIHLAGKRTLLPIGARAPQVLNETLPVGDSDAEPDAVQDAISDDIWNLAGAMVAAVDAAFRLDLSGDLELRMNLARHLGPLLVRLDYHMRLENPLRADIKSRYPFAYVCALEAATVLAEHCGAEVNDDEAAYLALAFALAMERRRQFSIQAKNVLIVCASGMGSAELLAMRCREEFADQLGDIRTCDVSQVPSIDFSDIDYLFTTVPLPCEVPVPVREVGYFLDRGDVEEVRQLLSRSYDVDYLLRYVSEDLFVSDLMATSDMEAINELAEVCRRHESISPKFVDYVVQREQSASTAFGKGVAIPHPIVAASDRTFVCVGLAASPIPWGLKQVEVVFLISVSSDPDEDLHGLYDALLGLASDERALASLFKDRRFSTLLALLGRALGPVPSNTGFCNGGE